MEISHPIKEGLETYFTNHDFSVKIADKQDIPEIVSLINRAFEYQDEAKGEKRINEASLQKKMSKSEFYAWRNREDQLVATCYITLESEKAHFGLLAVSDELRGGGLAPLIMSSIEEYARAKGKAILELDYMSLSPWLGPYYEKYGFIKTGFIEDIDWAELIQMQKTLV